MKKILLSVVLVLSALMVQAQNNASASNGTGNGNSFWDKMVINIDFQKGTKNKGMSPMSFGCQIGYQFVPHLYAFAYYENTVGLYNRNQVKTYTNTPNLGGGLGYRYPIEDDLMLEFRGLVAASVDNKDWKQTVYDARVLIGLSRCVCRPTFGLGYRHIASHTTGIDNYNGLYASIGISF